jgi:hypothetical protein
MASERSDLSFVLTFLIAFALQMPPWLLAGVVWGVTMTGMVGLPILEACLGGLAWGVTVGAPVSTFFALGLAWRPSAVIPVPDRGRLPQALDRVCEKLGFKVLTESAEEAVLGPKWTLMRFGFQEVRLSFSGSEVTLSAPAFSFWSVKKELLRALSEELPSDHRIQTQPENPPRS